MNNLHNKDIDSLKEFNKLLFNQYENLNDNYYNIISNILKTNKELIQKAKINYDNYIQSEKELYNLFSESKKMNNDLTQKVKENQEKNEIFLEKFEKTKKINKISELVNDKGKSNINYGDESDIKNICNLIKKLNGLGYNIDNGDITDSERKNLEDLLKNEGNKRINQIENDNNNEENKENYELGNVIVSLIERDVNDLYMRKLIEQVNIDQVDAITYCFSGENKKNEVSFNIDNNNLICSSGETFPVWLIKNFSL